MDRPLARLLGSLCLLLPLPTFAQSISTGDRMAASLPVDNPLAVAILALLISVFAFKLLRKHRALAAALPLAVAILAATQSPNLRALVELSFTNPAGQTLSIPVNQLLNDDDITGFEGADYTNASGTNLTISRIVEPNFAQCFPAGADALLPGFPSSSCYPNCAVGMTLADGETCHVSVEAICRDLAPGPELSSIVPAAGTASGGTGFILTGVRLTGATTVTFDGLQATSINVVNSTTVTGVTPAHTAGAVDIVITGGVGSHTLSGGYTYQPTAVGQASGGGTIACLNGGNNNLIATAADTSTGVQWGGFGVAVGAGAQSNTDGASNTAAIVTALGNNGGTPYAAQVCGDLEIDSQGNTPCQMGNSCYNDWFLPAGTNAATGQMNCLYTNRVAIGGFVEASPYWSSTEFSSNPASIAWAHTFGVGTGAAAKGNLHRARCVRAFTP